MRQFIVTVHDGPSTGDIVRAIGMIRGVKSVRPAPSEEKAALNDDKQ
jgi:hypothetical protein